MESCSMEYCVGYLDLDTLRTPRIYECVNIDKETQEEGQRSNTQPMQAQEDIFEKHG